MEFKSQFITAHIVILQDMDMGVDDLVSSYFRVGFSNIEILSLLAT